MALLDNFQGGIIVYYLQPGDPGYTAPDTNGLIVYPQVLTTAPWGCTGVRTGAIAQGVGSGSANTTAILSACTAAGIAAKVCNDLSAGGYSDWYLPSKDELNKVYLQRASLSFLNNTAGYWSSSETESDAQSPFMYTAYGQLFAQTQNLSVASVSKDVPYYVIAMRSF
jgi:hypothetical protein